MATCGAAPASALTGHKFKNSFGEPGHGDGQLELSGGFSGVAVNEVTHNVYVADAGNRRVDEFSEAGIFVRAFGGDVGGPGVDVCTSGCVEGSAGTSPGAFEDPTSIAIDNSPGGKGDVYVGDLVGGTVTKFEANGTIVASWGAGGQLGGSGSEAFGFLFGIAVEPSGNLAVSNSESRLFEFEPDGTFLTAFTTAGEIGLYGLAVDSAGDFFKGETGGVEKLDGLGDDIGTVARGAPTGIAVDPSSADLLVATGASISDYVFNGSGEVVQQSPPCPVEPFKGCPATVSFASPKLENTAGLAVDGGSGTVFVASAGPDRIVAFEPFILPDVVTEAASDVTKDSANLHGTISAAGGPEAGCEFQLTTKAAFERERFTGAASVPCVPSGPFNGNAAAAVTAEAVGLSAGTSYFFRLLGENEGGSSPDRSSTNGALSFRTPGPAIISSEATDVTATAATITGLIDLNGEATTYHVDYGPTESYGASTPIPDATAVPPLATGTLDQFGNTLSKVTFSQGTFVVGQEIEGENIAPGTTITGVEGSPVTEGGTTLRLSTPYLGETTRISVTSPSVAISQRLSGLAPGTGYHFRIVATNSAAAAGPDGTFTTYARESPIATRAYELVSPAQKAGEVIPPEPTGEKLGGSCTDCLPGLRATTMPMQTNADGNALVFEGQPFYAGLTPSANQYLAHRSEEGWTSTSITPPKAPAELTASGFKAISPELSAGVLLQTKLRLSPEAPLGEGGKSFPDLYRWEAASTVLQPLVTVKPPNRAPEEFTTQAISNGFQLVFAGANSGAAGSPAFEHLIFEANDALTPAVPMTAPAAPGVGVATKCGGFKEAANFENQGSNCNLYEWVAGRLRLVNVLPGNATAATHATIGSGRLLTNSTPPIQNADVDHAISADGSRIFWSDESGQVYVRIDGQETVKLKDPGRFVTAAPDGSKVLLNDGCLYSLATGSCETVLTGSPGGFLGILGASANLSRIYFVSPEALAAGAEAKQCASAGTNEEAEGKVPPGFGCNAYVYHDGEVTFVATLNYSDNQLGPYGAWTPSPSSRTAQVSPDGRFLTFMSKVPLTGADTSAGEGAAAGGIASKCGPACFEVYEYDLQGKSLTCPSCNPSGKRPLGGSSLSIIRSEEGAALPQPENLPAQGGGRLFFESTDALSSNDTNGRIQDVYEWTPTGVGGCARGGGCLALISSGHGDSDSLFLTATPDAASAFFVTREQLVPQDQDELLDVYDARIGGGIGSGGIAPCSGESCKGPIATPPIQPVSGSSQFSGPANAKKKHHKKKHHKKKHHKLRRANANRGGAK
jgi:hypothetical protein